MDAPFLQKIEAHRHEDHRGHERHAPIGCDEQHDDEPERERPQEYRTREIGRDAEPRWQEKTDAEPTKHAGREQIYVLPRADEVRRRESEAERDEEIAATLGLPESERGEQERRADGDENGRSDDTTRRRDGPAHR